MFNEIFKQIADMEASLYAWIYPCIEELKTEIKSLVRWQFS